MMDIEERPFQAIVAEKVFRTVGMGNSVFSQPLDRTRLPDAASGHLLNGKPLPGGERVYPEMAAAGLWTTPTDLARLLVDLQRTFRDGSGSLLSPETVREMVRIEGTRGMGLGFQVSAGPAGWTVEHAGRNDGFKSRMVASLDGGYGAVVMTNGERGAELANEIIRAIALTEGWAHFLPKEVTPLDPSEMNLKEYAGTFAGSPLQQLSTAVKGSRLVAVEPWGEETPMVPVGPDTFFYASSASRVHFNRDDRGEVVSLDRQSGSLTETMVRSEEETVSPLEALLAAPSSEASLHYTPLLTELAGGPGPAWVAIDDLAYRLLRGGFPEKAGLLFRFNADSNPENGVCQYGLADFYLKTGQADKALGQFAWTAEVLRSHPEENAPFSGLLERTNDQHSMLEVGR